MENFQNENQSYQIKSRSHTFRKFYLGHLTNIANFLIKKSMEIMEIKEYLSKREEWNDFVQNKLYLQNERNEMDLGNCSNKKNYAEKYEVFQEDHDDYDRIFKNCDIFFGNQNNDENNNEVQKDEDLDGLDVFYKTFSNSYSSQEQNKFLDKNEEIFEDIKFNEGNFNSEIKEQYFEDCNIKKVRKKKSI